MKKLLIVGMLLVSVVFTGCSVKADKEINEINNKIEEQISYLRNKEINIGGNIFNYRILKNNIGSYNVALTFSITEDIIIREVSQINGYRPYGEYTKKIYNKTDLSITSIIFLDEKLSFSSTGEPFINGSKTAFYVYKDGQLVGFIPPFVPFE